MDLFSNTQSEKDQSVIEPVGNQPTQPAAFVMSIDERNKLKKAMKIYYGSEVTSKNYSDFFFELIDLYIDEQDN